MNHIKTMKLALEALDGLSEPYDVLKAQDALRQAIEQAEQAQPVAYIRVSKTGVVIACAAIGDFYKLPNKTLLYTFPPKQEPIDCMCGVCKL